MSSTPFSNGFEVQWFCAARCSHCIHDDTDGGGCDEFALPVALGSWPPLLVDVGRSPANPLGVECTRFELGPSSTEE